jgi:uncharacterized protein YndB with AHSA1/START domain
MTEPIDTREITLTRVYDAPRETVFAMWTEAEHLARWWGPDGFWVPRAESDPRPGGALVIVMAGPGDFEETMNARYREVRAPELIVVDSIVPGPDGAPFIDSSHTVTFTDLGGRTEVTVRARASVFGPEGLGALAGMRAGWGQSLQCLDDALTGAADRQILLMRLYDAAPDVIFRYWVTAEHLEKWWGPDGFTISVDEFDPRPGGHWRFTMHGPDGADYPNHVTYREVEPDRRLVYVHGEAGDPDPSFTGVVTFEEMAGKTVLSLRLVFDSAQDRDLVAEKYQSVEGGEQTLGRLAALLAA